MTYLITLAEVQERYDISGNMNSRRFNAAVVNMQEMGLRLLKKSLQERLS